LSRTRLRVSRKEKWISEDRSGFHARNDLIINLPKKIVSLMAWQPAVVAHQC
jgi:hypothetical protein